jgi:hypothetical protein
LAPGLVKSKDASSTKSNQHEPPKAAAVLAAGWNFLLGNNRIIGNDFDPDGASRCSAARANSNTPAGSRDSDSGDEVSSASSTEETRQDLSRHRVLVWLGV